MVRMKLSKDEFDVKVLDIPYEGPKFERYHGEVPKTGTILTARITKMWFRMSSNNDSQFRVLAIAERNNGKLAEYNGLPISDYITFVKTASGRYQNFLMNFDLTVHDVFNKMDVQAEDDNIGTPVNSIDGWKVGSDDALCRISVKREWYADNEEWRAKVDWDGFMPYEEPEEERPARRSKPATSRRRDEVEEDLDDDDDEDDVEDEEEEDDIEDEDEDEYDEEPEPAPRHRRSSTGRPTRAARPAGRTGSNAQRAARESRAVAGRGARGARTRSRASGGSSEDPPF